MALSSCTTCSAAPLNLAPLSPPSRVPPLSAQNKMGIWSPLYYKINPSTDDEYAK
jgi:hypothetical protein